MHFSRIKVKLYFFIKRLLDLIVSIVGLIALPFFLMPISLAIMLEDKGPILYFSYRRGLKGKHFRMYKIRSMIVDAPDIRMVDGSTFNSATDQRVTKVGKFLRKTSLDELPQLANVFLGSMSIVGPRPDINKNIKYAEKINIIERVKPGITGYNQAYFRSESTWEEKILNDVFYVENMSFMFDLRIIFRTLVILLRREKTYRKTDQIVSLGK